MTRQIRIGVFETNSSSSHSFTLGTGKYESEGLLVDFGETCSIRAGEFGWGPERYRTARGKASYCLTWLKNACHPELEKRWEMFVRVVKRATGAESLRFYPVNAWVDETGKLMEDWGYIDHQSIEHGGGLGAEIFKDEETLERFIFDPNSVLVIDHDNH